MKKEKEQKKNKINTFFKSVYPIIILLIIMVVVLLCYTNYLINSSKTYMFNATSDYVEIYNGIISLNYDVNVLEGSDITYRKDKDKVVTKYKIGYYVKDGDNLVPIAVIQDADESGFSLKALLEGVSTFNLTELNKNNNHFSKKAIKLIDDGVYFVIEAESKDGETILDNIKVNLTKLSRK